MIRKWMILILALVLVLGGAAAETELGATKTAEAGATVETEPGATNTAQANADPVAMDATRDPAQVTPTPTVAPRLAGIIIGIDPGHQEHGNNEQETVSPTSSETKAKVSSGTAGRSTGIAEYVTNLEISLKLRDALTALGCTVYMTRETNEVDISNQERAKMMNDYGANLVLRLHCDGSDDSSAHGMAMYVRETGDCATESAAAADVLLSAMAEVTGAKARGVFKRDSYTGLNWSTVPSILVEMGFMSNAEEDEKLNDPAYQDQVVQGIVEGICRYFER